MAFQRLLNINTSENDVRQLVKEEIQFLLEMATIASDIDSLIGSYISFDGLQGV